jgi:hypothetical protein
MLIITIEGDLHVAGNVTAGDPGGLPIGIRITGRLSPFSSTQPERGSFIDGPLIVQGDVIVQGNDGETPQ